MILCITCSWHCSQPCHLHCSLWSSPLNVWHPPAFLFCSEMPFFLWGLERENDGGQPWDKLPNTQGFSFSALLMEGKSCLPIYLCLIKKANKNPPNLHLVLHPDPCLTAQSVQMILWKMNMQPSFRGYYMGSNLVREKKKFSCVSWCFLFPLRKSEYVGFVPLFRGVYQRDV